MTITVINDEEKKQLYDAFPESILSESDLCIGALQGDELYGLLTAKQILPEAWDVTFIHVDDAWRRHHIAEDMFRLLEMTVRNLGAEAISAIFFREKEDALFEFAVRNGFEVVSESGVLGARLSAVLDALDDIDKIKDFSGMIIHLNNATDPQWNELNDVLEEKRSEQDKKRGEESGMLYIVPEPKNYYNTDVSVLALDKKNKPCGAILMREGEDYFAVDYLVSLLAKDPTIVINMMRQVCDAMSERYRDVDIHFHTYNPAAEKLAKGLLGRFVKDEGRVVYMVKYL